MNAPERRSLNTVFAAVAGGAVLGVALLIRESLDMTWQRATVAGLGAALGLGLFFLIQKSQRKEKL